MNTPSTTNSDNDAGSELEHRILEFAREHPEQGQAAVAAKLRAEGFSISPSGVRYIWKKHDLETAIKRLRALAQQSPDGVDSLTEGQQRLLERGNLTAHLTRQGSSTDDDTEITEEPLERRQIIINAAAELFSVSGYDRTSIRDIAARVGLLPGSVYHHFPSKEELYLAVLREGFVSQMARIKAAVEAGSDPWEKLKLACQEHVHGIVDSSPIHRITGHNLALSDNLALLEKIKPYRQAYEDIFRQLIDALPTTEKVDRSLLRLFLLGGMNWIFLWYREGGKSGRQIADLMVDMIRNGVGPRPLQ
jgi:AcrR family transcriptional regulator